MSIFTAARARVVQLLSGSRILPTRVRRFIQCADPSFCLPVDVYFTVDEVVVVASVGGLKSSDIEISLVDDILTIEGKFAPLVKNVTYALCEREKGCFGRKLALSVPVDARKATATLKDGLLTVVLPKTPESQPVVVLVPVEA